MTTKHDYKAALVDFNSAQIDTEMPTQALVLVSYDTIYAIEHALKIADKLMQEPSEGMTDAAINSYAENGKFALVSHFKAMRDQMLKEVE